MGVSSNLLCEDGLDMACPGMVPPKHILGPDQDSRETLSAAVLQDGTQFSPTRPLPCLFTSILAPQAVIHPLAVMVEDR